MHSNWVILGAFIKDYLWVGYKEATRERMQDPEACNIRAQMDKGTERIIRKTKVCMLLSYRSLHTCHFSKLLSHCIWR